MKALRVIAISFFMVCTTACRNELPEVPEQLIGNWVTDDARYAGRALEITHTQVHIVLANDEQKDLQELVAIRRKPLGRATLFTFTTQGKDGDRTKLTFEYDPAEGGTLRFPNQKLVWHRALDVMPGN